MTPGEIAIVAVGFIIVVGFILVRLCRKLLNPYHTIAKAGDKFVFADNNTYGVVTVVALETVAGDSPSTLTYELAWGDVRFMLSHEDRAYTSGATLWRVLSYDDTINRVLQAAEGKADDLRLTSLSSRRCRYVVVGGGRPSAKHANVFEYSCPKDQGYSRCLVERFDDGTVRVSLGNCIESGQFFVQKG